MPFCSSTAWMCSDSVTGTRGSLRPCWMKSGARIASMCVIGDASTRNSRSRSSEPYSRSRAARRYGEVFSRNVTRLEMPTHSMPAAQSSGWNASAGEHHVAAVRAAVDDRARAVDLRARAQPLVQRREIAHRVEPLLDVVEMLVALAVPRRAAHVRRGDRVAARRRGTASAARSSARTTAATATRGRRAR